MGVVYDSDCLPLNFNRGTLLASIVLPGHVKVYGFTVTSTNAGSQFVLVFDSATLPADGAVPLFGVPVSASNFASAFFGIPGRSFEQGLTLCNSSTLATKTIGSADCFFDVQYDLVSDGNVVA